MYEIRFTSRVLAKVREPTGFYEVFEGTWSVHKNRREQPSYRSLPFWWKDVEEPTQLVGCVHNELVRVSHMALDECLNWIEVASNRTHPETLVEPAWQHLYDKNRRIWFDPGRAAMWQMVEEETSLPSGPVSTDAQEEAT